MNQRHFLAGRRSWVVRRADDPLEGGFITVKNEDGLFFLETAAFERYSHFVFLTRVPGAVFVQGMTQAIIDIWTTLLRNFVEKNKFVLVEPSDFPWPQQYGVYYQMQSFPSLDAQTMSQWADLIADIRALHPALGTQLDGPTPRLAITDRTGNVLAAIDGENAQSPDVPAIEPSAMARNDDRLTYRYSWEISVSRGTDVIAGIVDAALDVPGANGSQWGAATPMRYSVTEKSGWTQTPVERAWSNEPFVNLVRRCLNWVGPVPLPALKKPRLNSVIWKQPVGSNVADVGEAVEAEAQFEDLTPSQLSTIDVHVVAEQTPADVARSLPQTSGSLTRVAITFTIPASDTGSWKRYGIQAGFAGWPSGARAGRELTVRPAASIGITNAANGTAHAERIEWKESGKLDAWPALDLQAIGLDRKGALIRREAGAMPISVNWHADGSPAWLQTASQPGELPAITLRANEPPVGATFTVRAMLPSPLAGGEGQLSVETIVEVQSGVARLSICPAESAQPLSATVSMKPADLLTLEARAFDAVGNDMGVVRRGLTWTVGAGLENRIPVDANVPKYLFGATSKSTKGKITAKFRDCSAVVTITVQP